MQGEVVKGTQDETDRALISRAIAISRSAEANGNHPFGALLAKPVEGGMQIVLEAENTVITERDPTRHAELNLVSLAARTLTPEQLQNCVLYTSTEPCAMCTGAIVWLQKIKTIVYACSGESLGEIAGGYFVVPSRQLVTHCQERIDVRGPVLEEEAVAIHKQFWPKKKHAAE